MATTFHAVEMATARHMRRLAATSPILGLSSNTSSPSNSASQQTLLTSHVNTQSSTHSRSNTSRVVAETPPVIVSPHNRMTAEAPPAKPAAARNILNKSTSNPKRKSIPKRKNPSIKDKSVMHSPEPNKKSRSEPTELRSPKATSGLSELSRGSNPASLALSKKKITPPANNMRIHDFFSAATKKKKDNTNVNTETPTTATTNSMAATTTNAASENSTNTASNAIPTDWQAKCQKLQQVLQDKEEQLKAVTNNKTILHTALQSALTKTKAELQDLEASSKQRNTQTSNVLEELLRWKSAQQAKELRERLAADGARLGRIVYARAGMRALENWEEGYATKDLEHRKAELKKKHKALEQRLQSSSDKENQTRLDAMETQESIQMHLENFRTKERELNDEEKALNDEKGAHIRALKRVASEDASRFRSRPKLHDRYVLHCLLGKGGFSEVWRGYDLEELREVAVKIHQLDPRWPDSKKENYTKHVSREYEIHRNVRHPRIVSLYDVFEIDNNSFATVLECCKGTDLDTLLKSKKRLPERQARAILLQILSGMTYLSQPSGSRQGIIHYDLKPGNILFDEVGDAKITDFGLSKIVDAPDPAESMELTSQGAGTYWYLPPECFITDEKVRISNKVDVWSIGVIYYQMLYGVRPFGEGKSQDKLLTDCTMLNAQEVHFYEKPHVSEAGKAFIRQCLMYDQAFRPTIAQLSENTYVLNEKL